VRDQEGDRPFALRFVSRIVRATRGAVARQALCWLHEYNLDLPVKQTSGDTPWRRPNYSTIHRIIENPVYGGAYAYGKTAVAAGYTAEGVSVKIRRKARNEWLALKPNTHDGYVSWERFEAIRAMVAATLPLVDITARPSMETRCWPVWSGASAAAASSQSGTQA